MDIHTIVQAEQVDSSGRADINWKIWKRLGVGVKYQPNSIDYTGTNSTAIDTTMGYVSYVF